MKNANQNNTQAQIVKQLDDYKMFSAVFAWGRVRAAPRAYSADQLMRTPPQWSIAWRGAALGQSGRISYVHQYIKLG
jgi:hypothetical protein